MLVRKTADAKYSAQDNAKCLAGQYELRSADYDAVTLSWRTHATRLELLAAILLVIHGANSAGGLFQAFQAINLGPNPGLGEVAGAFLTLAPTLVGLAAGIVSAYIGVVQPRQKEAVFSAASAACKTVERVCSSICDMKLEEPKDYENAIIAIYRVLETATDDAQIPYHNDGSKKEN